MLETPSIYCYVTFTISTGEERTVRRCYVGADHESAARQAFRSVAEGGSVRVTGIETFDGSPRRWGGDFEVSEIG